MTKAEKEYKVTYKAYYNERLKKSYFHTRLIHPLYIQVIFDRIPITFKSYYFELFSKPKYAIRVAGKIFTPDAKQIIAREKALIDFIIDNNQQSFSLELFKKEYAFYCRDLLDIMEDGFANYLYTFFHDEGLPFMADVIKQGQFSSAPYNLVLDFRRALNDKLFKKLIKNSFYLAPPYLPLYSFAEQSKTGPLTSLTVMEWRQPATRVKFSAFFKKQYPSYDIDETLGKIQSLIK